jgi:hypothetical protein
VPGYGVGKQQVVSGRPSAEKAVLVSGDRSRRHFGLADLAGPGSSRDGEGKSVLSPRAFAIKPLS